MTKPTPLSPAEITDRLKMLPGWRLDAGALVREYQTDGWPTTLMLVNAIGFVAEAADHHPDLAVSWGKVGVKLWTHSAGGVTASDVELVPAPDPLDTCARFTGLPHLVFLDSSARGPLGQYSFLTADPIALAGPG